MARHRATGGREVHGFIRWRQLVTGTEVTRRFANGLTVKDQQRRRLVSNFKDTMKAYNVAVSRHDVAVQTARKAKLAADECSKI